AKLGGCVPHRGRFPGKIVLLRGLARLLEMLATQAILSRSASEHGALPPNIAAFLHALSPPGDLCVDVSYPPVDTENFNGFSLELLQKKLSEALRTLQHSRSASIDAAQARIGRRVRASIILSEQAAAKDSLLEYVLLFPVCFLASSLSRFFLQAFASHLPLAFRCHRYPHRPGEGLLTRLKSSKRPLSGRGDFEPVRQRFLHAA